MMVPLRLGTNRVPEESVGRDMANSNVELKTIESRRGEGDI